MTQQEYVIVLMESVHQHMAMEECLDRHDVRYRTIVKPRALSSECGTALKIDILDLERVRNISKNADLKIFGVFSREEEGWKPLDA